MRLPTPHEDVCAALPLSAFDPIWDVLHAPEKERVLRLLIEKVTYDGRTEDLTITFRPTAIATLAAEARGAARWQRW